MGLNSLVAIACVCLSIACPFVAAAAPTVLPEAPVCEASALHFIPCVGAHDAERCVLVGDNEEKKRVFQYRVSAQGVLTPATPWQLDIDTKVDDIEAIATKGSDVIVVGSHSRKKKGDRVKERLRIAVLARKDNGLSLRNTVAAESELAWADTLANCATQLIVPPESERDDNIAGLVREVCAAIARPEQRADEPGLSDNEKQDRVAHTFNIEGAVVLPDAAGTARLWVGLRAPLLDIDGATSPKAILLRVASLVAANDGVRFDGVATVALGGKGVRELTRSEGQVWGIAGDVADSANDNQLWHVPVGAIRNGDRIEHVTFEPVAVPSTAEGLAVDPSSARALVVTDGDKNDCTNNPAQQMIVDLQPSATWGVPENLAVADTPQFSVTQNGSVLTLLFDNASIGLGGDSEDLRDMRLIRIRIPVSASPDAHVLGYLQTMRGAITKTAGARALLFTDLGGVSQTIDLPFGEGEGPELPDVTPTAVTPTPNAVATAAQASERYFPLLRETFSVENRLPRDKAGTQFFDLAPYEARLLLITERKTLADSASITIDSLDLQLVTLPDKPPPPE